MCLPLFTCMAIDVSVQHNVGSLPEIILLRPSSMLLHTMKNFCISSLSCHLNVLTISPLIGWMLYY